MNWIRCWHFAPDNMRTLYTNEPIVVGETLRHYGAVKLCLRGLHGSIQAIDALQYAPDQCCICRVEIAGNIKHGSDKLAGSQRTCLWALTSHQTSCVLREFACRCGVKALTAARITDHRIWGAIVATRRWMRGDIDESARNIAWSDTWYATRGKDWDTLPYTAAAFLAARYAAEWVATENAVSGARNAAWNAMRSVRVGPSYEAIRGPFNQVLEDLATEACDDRQIGSGI